MRHTVLRSFWWQGVALAVGAPVDITDKVVAADLRNAGKVAPGYVEPTPIGATDVAAGRAEQAEQAEQADLVDEAAATTAQPTERAPKPPRGRATA